MRARADRARILALLDALGREVRSEHTLYLAGGATAVTVGWRDSTLDVDLLAVPDSDEILSAISRLKERLDINIETASPLDFLPPVEGWEERSPHLRLCGKIEVRQLDFGLQALSKLERGSDQDLADVRAMAQRGLITAAMLSTGLEAMSARLFRYPAVDAASFREAVNSFIAGELTA